MTSKRRSSLTGSWSGAFRYPGDRMPETVFNAQIKEEPGGVFTGSIQEPTVVRRDLGPVADAEIEGAREGTTLNFIKFYSCNGGMGHTVTYDLGEEAAVELEAEAPIEVRE